MNHIKQTKLTKEEWEFTEKPCNNTDLNILKFINNCSKDINLINYKYCSLNQFLKINDKDEYIFYTLFYEKIQFFENKYKNILKNNTKKIELKDLYNKKNIKINSATKIKLNNTVSKINNDYEIFENSLKEKILSNKCNFKYINNIIDFRLFINISYVFYYIQNKNIYHQKYYTYLFLKDYETYNRIFNINTNLVNWINNNILYFMNIELIDILKNYKNFVIKNIQIDEKIQLYDHQKELIRYFNNKNNEDGSLIFYSAPTGTGKTMTPVALVNKYKIIFICAARHVGLTLANYMISMNKKVGFAFGCEQMEDIRLHNNAISEYIEIKKGKKIFKKPNHENGEKVEIIICDIQSYYYAMLYMKSFHEKNDIILYWDEPTISLDYQSHELHDKIKYIMTQNQIPNIVLSSATLPDINEVSTFINSFKEKFMDKTINVKKISSDIFQNNISIYKTDGNVVIPHNLWLNDTDKLNKFLTFYNNNKYLHKYLDIDSCINFILDIHELLNSNYNKIINIEFNESNKFININNQNITNIYLNILTNLNSNKLELLKDHFRLKNINYVKKSLMYLTSHDSYTITNGPCLYLSNNYEKIIQVLYKTSKIPNEILSSLLNKLEHNNELLKIIDKNVKLMEDIMDKELEKENKMASEKLPPQARKIKQIIDNTREQLHNIEIDNKYIPNRKDHFNIFHSDLKYKDYNLWTCNIDQSYIESILNIDDVEPIIKVMLIIGIGVFDEKINNKYINIMKELAKEQKLFIIIAPDDYIYGTNYQFSHGYLGKDVSNITQEKLIQSMGRIGRQSVNKDYSFRLRDDTLVDKIYFKSNENIEIQNMNNLFS